MPCRVYDDGDELKEARDQANMLARLLCAQCRAADRGARSLVPEVASWWAGHQEADRKREAKLAEEGMRSKLRTQLARKALAKLTSEERHAIGVDRETLQDLIRERQ
jgi:hypothetical protein